MKNTLIITCSLALIAASSACNKKPNYTRIILPAWGTTCEVIYENKNDDNLIKSIDSLFQELSLSFSNYDSNSIIAGINLNNSLYIDKHLLALLELSQYLFKVSNGNFDPTIFPLVKHWGFMNKQGLWADTNMIDSMLVNVGLTKWSWTNREIKSKPTQGKIDFNAVAPGYAADIIALFLKEKGINNFYINNGGELVLSGNNKFNKPWNIGITDPLKVDQGDTIFSISNISMATSGNYRNYFSHKGIKYGHTIDTKTGYPKQTNIISATVFAKSAALADGYATICMTMNLTEVLLFLKKENLMAYLIYETSGGVNKCFIPHI